MQAGWDKIFQLLQQGQKAAEVAQMPAVAEQMGEGQTLVLQSLRNSGQFREWELSTLEVGLAAGDINYSYQRLQAHYTVLDQFRRQLRGSVIRHVMVVVVVVIAAYCALLYEQQLTGPTVLLSILGSVAVLIAGVMLVVRQILRIVEGRATAGVLRWACRLPLVAEVIRADQLQHCFLSIHQVVSARLPLSQALGIAVKKLPHRVGRSAFIDVQRQVSEGNRFSEALISVGLLRGIPVAPLSQRVAGPQQAMRHLAEAVQEYYLEQLARLSRAAVQLPYALLILVALVQWLVLMM